MLIAIRIIIPPPLLLLLRCYKQLLSPLLSWPYGHCSFQCHQGTAIAMALTLALLLQLLFIPLVVFILLLPVLMVLRSR